LKKIRYEQYKGFLHELPLYDISEAVLFKVAVSVRLMTYCEDEAVCENTNCIYYLEKGKIVEYY